MEKYPIWGLIGSACLFFPSIVNFGKGKSYIIILLHEELVSFHYHSPQIQNVCISMILGPSGNVHDPQPQFFLTSALQKCYKKQKRQGKYQVMFYICL